MSSLPFRDLIGRVIIDSFFNKDDGCIYMATHTGVVLLEPYGDCCAYCFIQHVSNSDALRQAVLLRIEDMEGATETTCEQYGDVTETWGHVFHTDKGTCTVEMRVDHNGYYGGRLNLKKINKILGERLEDF